MSTFNIPMLPFFVNIFLKTAQLSCRRKQFNSPPQLENQKHCRRKTTQLCTRNETTRLSREETTQLVNRNETTQLCTAVDRLQPPAPPLQQNLLFLPTLDNSNFR
ncbi:hypothetical protein TNCV_3929581 [Trichonephila clavipes]|nr:hypothetical protein TNCV_3929581 [Trichonephila clavipes]